MKASEYQRLIFLNGLSGIRPELPFTWDKLEKKTRDHLSREAECYIFGGAGAGETMSANLEALRLHRLVPRMLSGKNALTLERNVFGQKLAHPVITSPVGVLEMVHKNADLALAEACKETHTLMVISSQASRSVEEITKVLGTSPRWFQLYWNKETRIVKSFVERAENSGCSAIVLTVDTTIPGWRTSDLESGFLPFLVGKGIAQYVSDPVFMELASKISVERQPGQRITLSLLKNVMAMNRNLPGGFLQNLRSKRAIKSIRFFSETFPHAFLNWDHVDQIKQWTNLPVVIKGIQHREDAVEAIRRGADGVWISNHGGRQVDGAIGSFDAFKQIQGSGLEPVPLFFDSGIRSGADAAKAVMQGAGLCGIGRLFLCGLALNGVKGAVEVIQNTVAELETTLTLCGASSEE